MIPLPTPTIWDYEHLETCHSSVRVRRLLELGIVRMMLQHMVNHGCIMTLDGGGDEPDVENSNDVEELMAAAFAVDDCIIHVKAPNTRGRVQLVYGNDGYDVISNYSVNLEDLLKPVNGYAEQLSFWS